MMQCLMANLKLDVAPARRNILRRNSPVVEFCHPISIIGSVLSRGHAILPVSYRRNIISDRYRKTTGLDYLGRTKAEKEALYISTEEWHRLARLKFGLGCGDGYDKFTLSLSDTFANQKRIYSNPGLGE